MRVHYSFQFTFVKMEEEAFLGGKKINNDVKVSFFRQKKVKCPSALSFIYGFTFCN